MHRRPDPLRPRRCAGTPFTVAASLALTVGLLGSATAAHAAVAPTATPTPTASAGVITPALSATSRGELVLVPGEKPAVGTQVKWFVTVTNTGDVPLTDVAPALVEVPFTLEPGQTREVTLTSTLDQKNLTNGYADLDALVSGATPTGARVGADLLARLPLSTPTPTPTTPAPVPAGQGALTATVRGELVLKPGEKPTVGTEVKWTITVTNTGDVPLDDTASKFAGPGLHLEPGQARELTSSTTLDQERLATGFANLDDFATATRPDGALIAARLSGRLDLPSPSPTTSAPVPAGQGVLTATARGELVLKPGEKPTVGTEVKWTITLTNTGDVPLDDVAFPIAGYRLVLKPGQSRDLTSSTILDQKLLAAGYQDLDVFTGATIRDGARVSARIRGLLVLPSPTPSPTAPAPASALPGPSPATPALAPAAPVPAT
ncbi:putative repeat protein (TIGR01451 family) [Rathayibacter sp. PhB151]|uniref:DUF7507 domain-containing protein n=1 Tax=Rathayibacter sp. PhB151 TaxID=2485189 RepID=UPI0010644D9E|nr:hypothetical protein [Rathayibacter sp. PhB151]TDX77277.1 putative repeat protein (TIGR01451 family) [Rathayibacter sp. PhB151]